MTTTAVELERFLTRFRQLQQAGQIPLRTTPAEFLDRARTLSGTRNERRRQTAERFNVFEVLGCLWSELDHSRFLAYLLDPGSSHDQGMFFLNSFLQRVNLAEWRQDGAAPAVSVYTEFAITEGRLDLVLFFQDGRVLAIENKIGAQEQPRQLERYQEWLASLPGPLATKTLVYLTPSGITSASVPVRTLSYQDLGRWIDDISGTAPPALAVVLGMYHRACTRVSATFGTGAQIVSQMNDELTQLLQDPANLRTAYDVRDSLAEFEQQVFQDFWSRVRGLLDGRLAAMGCAGTWRVAMPLPALSSRSHVSIVPSQAEDADLKKWRGVTAECLGSRPERCFFGIWGRVPKGTGLRAALSADKFASNDIWIAYRYFDGLGLPDFYVTRENVLALRQDNLNESHPIAQAVANHVGDLFEKCRMHLEEMNALPSANTP